MTPKIDTELVLKGFCLRPSPLLKFPTTQLILHQNQFGLLEAAVLREASRKNIR